MPPPGKYGQIEEEYLMNHFVSYQWWIRLPALFALLALGLVHADITKAQSFEYRLGPGDRIQVAVFGRSDLSGIYTIRNSGFLSLPIAGEINTSNLTLSELEMEVGNRYSVLMKSKSGPDQTISVNIEIVEHRPFYIMGDVSKPGSYEYQSRLTVLRAVAIAGGYASSGPGARVSESRSQESMNVHKNNYIAAIAREARLTAERKKLDKVTFPPGLLKMEDDSFVVEIIDVETQLFTVRRELLEQELKIIHKRKLQFEVEDKALEAQFAAVERKRKEIDKMLAGAQKLSSDGLVPRSDLSSFVIMQADIERESRELVVAHSRAKQGISEMEQQALILRGERIREIASELERVRLRIDETLLHLRAEADRLAILKVKTLAFSDSAGENDRAKVRITRETDWSSVSFDAVDNTVVLPGDIISVPYQEGEAFLSLPDRGQD